MSTPSSAELDASPENPATTPVEMAGSRRTPAAHLPPAGASPASLRPGRPRSKSRQFSRRIRILVSLGLVLHLTALVSAPASVSPSSQLAQQTWSVFRPWLQLLYLNHGYHFFAPEPSQSTLISYTLHFADGHEEQGRFPHFGIRPRLLYHRHFMLTEFLNFAPQTGPDETPWVRTYAEHLGQRYGAERVTLRRQLHYLPTMEAVRNGIRLDNPESYVEQPLGTFECRH